MKLFKTHETVYSPITGIVKDITFSEDEIFASKALGDGVVIIPSGNTILAPIDGIITSLADTKHSFGITNKSGIELLVHIGIDTVSLDGQPFTICKGVTKGTKVFAGQKIMSVNLEEITASNLSTQTMVANTSNNVLTEKVNTYTDAGDEIFKIQ